MSYVFIGTFVVGGAILGSGGINFVTQSLVRLFLTILLLASVMIVLIGEKISNVISGKKVATGFTFDKKDNSIISSHSGAPSNISQADYASFSVGLINKKLSFGHWEDGQLIFVSTPKSVLITFVPNSDPVNSVKKLCVYS